MPAGAAPAQGALLAGGFAIAIDVVMRMRLRNVIFEIEIVIGI
jgi:hypothetical protein